MVVYVILREMTEYYKAGHNCMSSTKCTGYHYIIFLLPPNGNKNITINVSASPNLIDFASVCTRTNDNVSTLR